MGGLTLAWIFVKDLSTCIEGPQIFTLNMILRTFVEKCRKSQLRAIMGQITQDAWIGGWGVNLI